MRGSKFRNIKVEYDGVLFDSKKEAARWRDLTLLQKAGEISNLQRQVTFPIIVNNVLVCKYIADFSYHEKGNKVIEDVKSEFTKKLPVYSIKKKLMRAVHGLIIREV